MTKLTGVTHRKVKIPSNKERTAFLFMRLSGVFLLFLAVSHVLVQHVVNSVHDLDIQFVIERWSSVTIKGIDLLLLYFALIHGINGLRNTLEDYVHSQKAMRVINVIMAVFLVISLIFATVAIVTFNPES
jgi:succinate dehydrogenase / fumarate reductase membrane anchor subunit